ncbi:MAG: LysM peptidoglycan-binding domain-containing M23 family metallopeptidase [Alphaproteobacteria bacterium]|nr:LysM peptidoglycan-binding domain-containing M23 family metallopeptidase [Alphaproteobacteria bacterium]
MRFAPSRHVVLLFALAGFVLAGCSGVGPRLANRGAATQTSIPADGVVVVRPGDTVYAIARRYGVSPRTIIEHNSLRPPYQLEVGQRLAVPTPRAHVVRSGDTVSEIAYNYGVDMRSLVVLNDLRPPYLIRVGDRLRLPPSTRTPAAGSTVLASRAARPIPTPAPPPGTPPRSGSSPQAWSRDGQLYFRVPAANGRSSGGPEGPPLPTPRPSATDTQVADAKPTVSSSAARPVRTVSLTPPPRGGRRFLWPVEGRVIGGFGPRQGGLHNDGINIAAAAGTPIRAAENGVVVYAGNELRGFGNLLLIKHSGGWTTAYAHAEVLKVRRGDRVTRGQTIATVGRSGNVDQPQLHFEVRQGPRAVDPRKELPPAQVSHLSADDEPRS